MLSREKGGNGSALSRHPGVQMSYKHKFLLKLYAYAILFFASPISDFIGFVGLDGGLLGGVEFQMIWSLGHGAVEAANEPQTGRLWQPFAFFTFGHLQLKSGIFYFCSQLGSTVRLLGLI